MFDKLDKKYKKRLNLIYSTKEIRLIKKGFLTKKRLVTFRVNQIKTNNLYIENYLKNKGLEIEKISYLNNAYKLINGIERDLWKLDIYKKGFIYIQGISSQFPILFLNLKEKDKILDPSSAPGSKVSQISSEINNSGEILAIDNNQIRIDKLNFNLKRLSATNITVLKGDSSRIDLSNYKEYFDKILFDAPCSSDGRFNLNIEKTYKYWNLNIVKRNYKIQKYILKNIIGTLKKGGTLVYSTCSLSPEENEGIVHFLLCNFKELEIIDITKELNITNIKPGVTKFGDIVYKKDVSKSIRILPNEDMEGFFIAKFIKNNI